MTMAQLSYCDECRKDIEGGEYIYCSTCCNKLLEEITSLKNDIDILNDEITTLQKEKK